MSAETKVGVPQQLELVIQGVLVEVVHHLVVVIAEGRDAVLKGVHLAQLVLLQVHIVVPAHLHIEI